MPYYYGQYIGCDTPDAFREGYIAREGGEPLFSCPYPFSINKEYDDWIRGWLWHLHRCTGTSIFYHSLGNPAGGLDYHPLTLTRIGTCNIYEGDLGDGVDEPEYREAEYSWRTQSNYYGDSYEED